MYQNVACLTAAEPSSSLLPCSCTHKTSMASQRSSPAALLVQGQRQPCDAHTLRHFTAVAAFLDSGEDEVADGLLFPLPDWVTTDLWQSVLAYPGLQEVQGPENVLAALSSAADPPCPERQQGQAQQPIDTAQLHRQEERGRQRCAYLTSHWRHLADVAKVAEYLGYQELMELASAAVLLPMRPEFAKAALHGGAVSARRLQAAHTTPEVKLLQMLVQPVELDRDCLSSVVAIAPEAFWPLVDSVVAAGVVPTAGVVPGLTLVRVWPCVSAVRRDEQSVSGVYGGGKSMRYLELQLRLGLLEAYEPRVLVCKVRSHDQGWSDEPQHRNTYNGSCTFGTLEVAGKEYGERVYTNLTAQRDWQQHERILGPNAEPVVGLKAVAQATGPDASSATGVAQGHADEQASVAVALLMHAYYPGWCNHVSEASIHLYLLPKHDPGTLDGAARRGALGSDGERQGGEEEAEPQAGAAAQQPLYDRLAGCRIA